jgi:DNA-binding CsgD family transcriptional regulator
VLGDDTPLDLLSELAMIDREVAAGAADALVAVGLVDGQTRPRFRHPLLRSAVAASLTLSERERYHRDAAELLRRRDAQPERIAVHLLATAPGGSAADRRTLDDAAVRTVERGAPAAAVPLFRRLLDEPLDQGERAAVLLRLGRAEYAAGQLDAAAEHLEQAHYGAADPITAARALAQLLQASSVRTNALEQLADSAEQLIDSIQGQDREAALQLQAQTILIPRAGAPADERLAQLARLPGDTAGEAVILGHLVFRRISAGASAAEIADLAGRAARQVEAIVEDGTTTTAFTGVILGLRWSDHLDAAERALEQAIAIARRRGSTIDFANCLGLRGEVFLRRGMLREGEADGRVAQAAELLPSWWFARGLNPLLQSLVLQGRAEEAAEIITAELGDQILPDVPPMISLMLTRLQLRAALGDHTGAVAEFDEAVRRREKWGGITPSWIGDILTAADSHVRLGDHAAAGVLRVQARALADQWGTPGAAGQVTRADALQQSGSIQIEGLSEAVALLEQSPARLELTRALIDLGAALRRAGHRGEARTPLRRGYELARQCGADRLAETARQELAASGVRIRRERLTGLESLTPSERRIADMAANGSSNAEIAQALFVTVKTVEMHLTRIYRKLEIPGRSALAAALTQPAATPGRMSRVAPVARENE